MRKLALGILVLPLIGCGGGGSGSKSSGNPFAGSRTGTYALTVYSDGLAPDPNPNVLGTCAGTVLPSGDFTLTFGEGYSLNGHVAKTGVVTDAVYHYLQEGADATLDATVTMSVSGAVITLQFDAYKNASIPKGVHYAASLST